MGGLTVPFTISGATYTGRALIDNRGTAPAPAVLEIHGPVQFPQVVHEESGATLRFETIVDAGQWLEVDLDNHLVLLNGTASRRGLMRGDWFDLQPGTNTLAFGGASYNTEARLVVRWRDAYR